MCSVGQFVAQTLITVWHCLGSELPLLTLLRQNDEAANGWQARIDRVMDEVRLTFY